MIMIIIIIIYREWEL